MATRKRQTRKPLDPKKQRTASLKYLYGLTVEQWDRMLIDQSGLCVLCDEPMKSPHVDHSHVSGDVRGLLCLHCNTMLGRVERLGLSRIELYLDSHRRGIARGIDLSFVLQSNGTTELYSRKVRMKIGDKATIKTGKFTGTQVVIERVDGCYIRMPDGTHRWMASTNLAPIAVVPTPPVDPPKPPVPPVPPTNPLLEPINDLRVVDGRLMWTKREGAKAYEIATVIAGQDTTYIEIPGTVSGNDVLYTPPPRTGMTVEYGVRVKVDGSKWHDDDKRVEIVWPPAPKPEPGTTPTPTPGTGGGLIFVGATGGGAQSTNDSWQAGLKLGVKKMRIEFGIGSNANDVANVVKNYASKGIEVLPLAGFHGRLPSADEAKNLGNWAKVLAPLGVTEIEFGNETSYSYQGTQGRGGEYAQRFRDAFNAIQGSGAKMGLLAQADDGNSGSSAWVDAMFSAVPNLADMVAGWTVHPYGPESRCDARIDRLIAQTGKHTSKKIPIDITEWGLATDNGRTLSDNYSWDKAMDFNEAADALTSTLTRLQRKYGDRIRSMYYYQPTDQRDSGTSSEREHFFGALRRNMDDKGELTKRFRALPNLALANLKRWVL